MTKSIPETPWLEIPGTDSPRDMRVERSEQMLENVKGLYTESCEDGTPWSVTEGTGVPRDCRVERLEKRLAEVKQRQTRGRFTDYGRQADSCQFCVLVGSANEEGLHQLMCDVYVTTSQPAEPCQVSAA